MPSSTEIIEFYTQFAEKYDEVVFRDGDYIAYKKIPQWLIARFSKPSSILDLGCGTGLSSIPFFKDGHQVTGIDITPKMIEQCAKLPYKDLYCQSLEDPFPIKNHSYDAAIMLGVMEFIQDPLQLFIKIKNALKPNGLFALTLPKKLSVESEQKLGIKTYDPDEMEILFKRAGFSVEHQEDFQGFMHEGESVLYRGYLLKLINRPLA